MNTSLLSRVQLSSVSMDLLRQFVILDGMIEMQLHSVESSRIALTVSSYNNIMLSHKTRPMGYKLYFKLRLRAVFVRWATYLESL